MMRGFHHYVAVITAPYYCCAVLKNSVVTKNIRKKIPFRSSREWQKSAIAIPPLK